MTVHIVGCGTVGVNLAIELCKSRLASKLILYDKDSISYNKTPIYPFYDLFEGVHKISALSTYLITNKISNDIIIEERCKYVNKEIPTTDSELVIDCRDSKNNFIKPDLSISMDGPVLILNSKDEQESFDDFDQYTITHDQCYISLGCAYCVNYIRFNQYKKKEFKVIDLRNLMLTT